MQGITDRDIAYDMLFGCKQTAHGYCQAALEAASPSLYRTFMEMHERAQESHRRIWEYLHRRQEYRVSDAHPQEVQSARDRMERLRDDHLRGDAARGEAPRESRPWDRREFEPAGAGSRGGRWGGGWNGEPAGGGTQAGAGMAPGGGYGAGGFGGMGGVSGAAWDRQGERRFEPGERRFEPGERRFEPAPRY
jgi:hypothetical protein